MRRAAALVALGLALGLGTAQAAPAAQLPPLELAHRAQLAEVRGGGAAPAAAQEIPDFDAWVVDAANAVPDDAQRRAEDELEAFEQRTGMQLAVAVVKTTGNRSIEDFSIDLAREWGVGTRGRDDGVVLVVAVDDRRLRIEVGRDLEDELTDVEAGRIIRERLVPRLRQGDVGEAVLDGTRAIRAALGDTGGPGPGPLPQPERADEPELPWLGLLGLAVPVLAFSAIARRATRGRRGGGDGWGLPVFWGGMGGSGWGSGGGGFGGGFGGGGGGDFGGGGASGDW